mgnify:FL=1
MAAYTTIDDPSAYFKVQFYTGNGSANHAITFDDTDTDMQPDLVWIKNIDALDSHCLFDAVRGATKVMHTDTNADEDTDTDTLDSFTSDGFQVDADVKVNTNTEDYVAWCWKAGTTSGINATGADITPSAYSFNQTSGVSIIKYSGNSTSGAEVAHGLAAVPHLMIIKNIDYSSGEGWQVYHHKNTAAPETDALALHDNGATQDQASRWNDTAPGSVLFTLGNDISVNTGYTYLGLIFSEKQGFSKFGGYTGNGNADGTFVYTGFRPAYVLSKRTNGAADWMLLDSKRLGYNPDNNPLFPDGSGADSDVDVMDILSNGFKLRATSVDINGSGDTYIYAAFAEAPFVNSNGVPCNAR